MESIPTLVPENLESRLRKLYFDFDKPVRRYMLYEENCLRVCCSEYWKILDETIGGENRCSNDEKVDGIPI